VILPMHLFVWLGISFRMGCDPQPANDVKSLAKVLASSASPAERMKRCAEIADSGMQVECALAVVNAAAVEGSTDPQTLCDLMSGGLWQSECWFLAAEYHRKAGRDHLAASLCQRTGALVNDCGQHLWQTQVYDLIHPLGPRGFAVALPEAERIHGRWAPLLAAHTDLDDRFWRRFYQNGFEADGGVDLAHCDGLETPHAERCVSAALSFYARELAPKTEAAGLDVCSLNSQEDLVRVFPIRADPRLDAAFLSRKAELCPGTPPPG
jgi:hypothetical protein